MDANIILSFPFFLLATLLAFFIPGNIFVATLQLTRLQKITLSLSFGIVLWALQGFLFGYLQMRGLTYLYLGITLIIWLKINKHNLKLPVIKFPLPKFSDFLFGGFITVVVITQLFTSFENGITTTKGIYFCCGLPDNLFHIALTNDLVYNFPPHEPGVSGQILYNYHFLANLVNADIIRIFHLPLLYVQYPYMSLLITLLFALNIVTFSQLVTGRRIYSYWLLFFVFFSGDLLFLLIFLQTHLINFNATFLENASALWISPPRVYAAMLFFSGLSFFLLWERNKKNIYLDILLAATFGSLIEFKVYFGIFALTGLAALMPFYVKEKNIRKLIVIMVTFLISAGLFLPMNSGAGGFVFTGFWRFENFAANTIFGLQKMELARYVYLAKGNWVHALMNDLIYFILYFVFIFGTLLLSLFQTRKSLTIFDKKLNIFLLSGLTICFIFGSFFIQKTGGSNSSQFLITDMIIIAIYAALAVMYWLTKIKKTSIIMLITVGIIVLTAPRVLYEDYKLVTHQQGFLLDINQLHALTFLRNNTPKNAIILQSNLKECLQIVFIAQRHTYICNDASPSDHGEMLAERITLHDEIFKDNASKALSLLPQKHIQYLYLPTNYYLTKESLFKKNCYLRVYFNREVTILKLY